jgi:hypothetical protein
MTETQAPQSVLHKSLADPVSLAAVIDASLKRGSSLSIGVPNATIGVTLDKLGDWTITVGLSPRSNQFHQMRAALEALGFFQAAEDEVASYMLWTSILSEVEDGRATTEETLMRALKVLQARAVLFYIS